MVGVCPKCRTAYSWEFPRYGCACGRMSDVPPLETSSADYTALGRSPFAPNAWWNDRDRRDRDDRPRLAPPRTTATNPPPVGRELDARVTDWERERERDQRRREREEDRWDRWDRGRGRGRGGGRRRGRP